MSSPLVEPRIQLFDNNGNPLVGGKLYTYAAGTSTPKATFTTATGGVPNANPVILDSAGRASVFLSGSYKIELRTAANVLVWTADNITELLSQERSPFSLLSSVPTVLTASSFTVPGNQTAVLPLNQRIKLVTTTTTAYATVSSSAFGSGVTTVFVIDTTAPLNGGTPVGLYVGLGDPGLPIHAKHVFFPGVANTNVYEAIIQRIARTGDFMTGPLGLASASESVSAGILNIAAGDVIYINGSGWTLSDLGSVEAGRVKWLVAQGTGLISGIGVDFRTPGGSDIAVEANDVIHVVGFDKWYINKMTGSSGRLLATARFVAGGTFTPADFPGARSLKVTVKAGGAGGGGATVVDGGAAGGGSEGSEYTGVVKVADLAGPQTVLVGAGGGAPSGAGGSSRFSTGLTQVMAIGGGGGSATITAVGGRGGQGGSFAIGANVVPVSYARGACGHTGTPGTAAVGGAGGGAGGNGSNTSGAAGSAGLDGAGGGGGGGVRLAGVDGAGGVGGSGYVLVEVYS